ncbi:uncharacterized protein BDW47DRAFT_104486 [Aspergillus candidus]|uniref:Invertebrate defensins family profile domain-containing protein n=1 Tax=Aspergillus candidus TaxID=41067 RepID=A0A2I2FE52_ASPCN|nr:hypothetical protein BDW47DRAFT_104486 [Aspergillus candidus]PLB38894.1 hypothetical protein BDW47DRAFT_104486 [Aspergillus candidus]
MQFFKTAVFFSLVAVGLAAASEGDAGMMQKRGFGCPDDGPCNTHCKDIGRNGGYCAGFLQRVCTCNEKK